MQFEFLQVASFESEKKFDKFFDIYWTNFHIDFICVCTKFHDFIFILVSLLGKY